MSSCKLKYDYLQPTLLGRANSWNENGHIQKNWEAAEMWFPRPDLGELMRLTAIFWKRLTKVELLRNYKKKEVSVSGIEDSQRGFTIPAHRGSIRGKRFGSRSFYIDFYNAMRFVLPHKQWQTNESIITTRITNI